MDKTIKFLLRKDDKSIQIKYDLYATEEVLRLKRNDLEVSFPDNGIVYDLREFSCIRGDIYEIDLSGYDFNKCQVGGELTNIIFSLHKEILPLDRNIDLYVHIDYGSHFELYQQNFERFCNQPMERVNDLF